MKNLNLPKFQSNKIIGAVKIKAVISNMKGGAKIISTKKHAKNEEPESVEVSHNFMMLHSPKAGDYYTKDENGKVDIKDGEEFEKNYKA